MQSNLSALLTAAVPLHQDLVPLYRPGDYYNREASNLTDPSVLLLTPCVRITGKNLRIWKRIVHQEVWQVL